jgi:carbamoyltransferase
VEACPQDALRPRYGATSATLSRVLRHRPGWLSRLRGGAGQTVPALFPPSYLLPKPGKPGRRWILGLSATTMQEHAAALLERGQVAGAVEEERLARVRHYGYAPLGRPGVTIAADPTLTIEEALPRRAIAALLEPRRLSLDDMDIIAVNGLPARYRRAFSVLDTAQPLPTLRAGRVLYVPHHLCHAASAWRVSGQKSSWVLTVDGRGDRETAAVFRAERGRLRQIGGVLCLTDRSIGGVYETVTRLLGFGAHGQGSVMALGAFGKPTCDLSAFLSRRGRGDYVIHESGLEERFAACARRSDDALLPGHKDLAASLQAALEKLVLALLLDQGVKSGALGLCLAGGVALNCRMNAQLRRTLRPRDMFVQPGANDAGTALGAALEAAAGLGAVPAQIMSDPYLGPGFTPAEAEAALRRARLPYRRSSSIADECAELLARGEVVCWCQGRMEFGPRALGGRSILGDPRRSEMHARVNRLKGREPWRPFGPSILAGHELDWFAEAFDSRFMLFTVPLRSDRAGRVPAVAHVDGTSRPQSVHKETSPLFYSLISRFHGLTDVPMVLNTSFNRRGEPMVCSPRDAVDCFLDMPEADVLALGPFMTRRSAAGAATGKNWLRPDRNVQD